MKILPLLILTLVLHLTGVYSQCVHDQFVVNTEKTFYNDLTEKRLLMNSEVGKLRIFVDYSLVKVGGRTEINTVKRLTNITATYFYNVLTVERLNRLYYPKDTNRKCNVFEIPEKYATEGTIGDLGVICGNQKSEEAVYVAKSTACSFLESNKRPIWGIMSWNNAFLKFDQEGFQQMLFVGLHEMTHILGFSAVMYEIYPTGQMLFRDPENGDTYLSSPKINQEIKKHYNCNHTKGMLLEDQDGTLIASHWEQKVIGNQFMIASNKKGSFVSRVTLALLDSTGWYPDVDYSYAEPTVWGKNKKCRFFDIDDCDSPEFCSDNSFGCDWDATGIGKCRTSSFTGTCKVIRHYTNTICIDQNYELKNLNSKLNAFERGGYSSRCFISNFREEKLSPTKLNNRCYISICSFSGNFLFLLVGNYVLICRFPGYILQAPPGLQGTLTCPLDFSNYCDNKKTCAYHCNKNGACINGQCLCTGSLQLSPSCIDVSIFLAPVGSSGGLLNSIDEKTGGLVIGEDGKIKKEEKQVQRKQIKEYNINLKCIEGTILDENFGDCLQCLDVYNCENCNEGGCISCDDGKQPKDGRCKK